MLTFTEFQKLYGTGNEGIDWDNYSDYEAEKEWEDEWEDGDDEYDYYDYGWCD